MGSDDENLSRSLALISPAVPAACWNAGGITPLEVMDVFFERQFDGSLEYHRQLFRSPHVRFMPAPSARLDGNDHGFQLTVLIEWPKRLNFCAGPFALDHRPCVGSDNGRQGRIHGPKKLSKSDTERRGDPFG